MAEGANPKEADGSGTPGSLLRNVARSDALLPSMRSLEDARALLADMESEALETFSDAGLPTTPGLYRRSLGDTGWHRLTDDPSVEGRWTQIMERPPEAGFRYFSLSDVGRAEHPTSTAVLAAAVTLDRVADLRRLLEQDAPEEAGSSALLMFWSTVELMVILLGEPRRSGRAAARRALLWDAWRAEAQRIWLESPELSARAVAQAVAERRGHGESPHTVRRRLRRPGPTSQRSA